MIHTQQQYNFQLFDVMPQSVHSLVLSRLHELTVLAHSKGGRHE